MIVNDEAQTVQDTVILTEWLNTHCWEHDYVIDCE